MSSGSPYESAVGYSRAVRIGPYIAVAGTTGNGDAVGAQTRDALRRIELALRDVGATLRDVVRTRIFVTDITQWPTPTLPRAEPARTARPRADIR